jgi:hypothetical protein
MAGIMILLGLIILLFLRGAFSQSKVDNCTASDAVLMRDDIEETMVSLQSMTGDSETAWRLHALQDIVETGYSPDAVRLKEWLDWVDEVNG